MTTFELVLYGLGAVCLIQSLLYIYAWVRTDASIVDVGWSLGTGLLAVFYAVAGNGDEERRLAFGLLAGFWGFRLASFLFVNRVWGKHEDGRYQRLRAHWGARANLYFYFFFLVQAVWSVLFAIPYLVVVSNPAAGVGLWGWLGIALGLLAIAGESLSDWQLARFRANPANKGRTCRDGFWRYSRHPNYFFEWLHWWAYVLLAVGSPWWWVTLWGPLLMWLFLFYVTGIPHTEKQALASRGEDYARYQRETSMFIPWFPKKELAS